MKALLTLSCLTALLLGACTAPEQPEAVQEEADTEALSIEGIYRLVSRVLPDGTEQRAPDVMGMLTYTQNYRNFNVLWKDADGKFFSYSVVSTYELTESEYSEKIIFSILNDQIGGQEITYDLSEPDSSVTVIVEEGRIEFDLPFDPVTVIFEGDKFTAEGSDFVDYWEKVQ